jgi:hypothetical protein
MQNKILLLVICCLTLTSCGYQGWVRYPCQEYKNWENAQCKPPQCEALGQCSKDLLPEVEILNG